MKIKFEGLGDTKVSEIVKSGLANNTLLFSSENIHGRFTTGGSGPRLEVFAGTFDAANPYSGGQHICGCSLERQEGWLGGDDKGTFHGANYGHRDLPSLTLKELLDYLAPQWLDEKRSGMSRALEQFEGVESLVADMSEEVQ